MKKRLTKMVLLAFTLSMFSSVPSFADEDNNVSVASMENGRYLSENKIDQSYDLPTAEDKAWDEYFNKMIDKIKVAYEQYYAGEITIDELQKVEDACYFALYPEERDNPEVSIATNPERKEAVENSKDLRTQQASRSFAITPFAIGDGQTVYLSMPYEAQVDETYCGPATAVNIVNGYNNSARITQSQAATLLQTNQLGSLGTNFGSNWLNVLNTTYMGKTYHVKWGSYGWAADLADKSISTLLGGRGVALNLYMDSNTGYLPGYNSSMGTVGHYVAAYGFDSRDPSRRKIHYLDPNGYNYSAWGAHTVTYQEMARATENRGIIY